MPTLFLSLASLTLLVGLAKPGDLPREIKPVVVWTGADSKQAKALFIRCVTQKEWQSVWHNQHGRDDATDLITCPELDFDAYMVIAIFYGKGGSDRGIRIDGILEEKDCLRIRYTPAWYQTAQANFVPNSLQSDAETKKLEKRNYEEILSYAFVVLPRSEKMIVFEEDVRHLISAPPLWKERTRLAAMKKD